MKGAPGTLTFLLVSCVSERKATASSSLHTQCLSTESASFWHSHSVQVNGNTPHWCTLQVTTKQRCILTTWQKHRRMMKLMCLCLHFLYRATIHQTLKLTVCRSFNQMPEASDYLILNRERTVDCVIHLLRCGCYGGVVTTPATHYTVGMWVV